MGTELFPCPGQGSVSKKELTLHPTGVASLTVLPSPSFLAKLYYFCM